jgi:putative FmdB family regulatory protein
MPIFEYSCVDCGTRFEKLVRRAGETDGLACPSCGEKHLKQELSTFAAHAGNGQPKAQPMGGGCPAGMCRTPDLCGRN